MAATMLKFAVAERDRSVLASYPGPGYEARSVQAYGPRKAQVLELEGL